MALVMSFDLITHALMSRITVVLKVVCQILYVFIYFSKKKGKNCLDIDYGFRLIALNGLHGEERPFLLGLLGAIVTTEQL